MITIEPEPMNGPPSWRCQTGAGNLARSRSLPLIECCRKAASLTTTGARGCNVLRFSIHALSASSGRNFGSMPSASKARRGLYVSDGTVNVALLKQEGDEKVGIYHFGMWVDDLDEAEKKVVGAGGKYLAGRPEPAKPGVSAHSYYEAKYKDPLGIVFDLTHTGWVGAVKDVVAAKN